MEKLKLINNNEEGTLSDSNAKVTDSSLVPNVKNENVSLVDNKENKIQAENMEERQNQMKQITTISFDVKDCKTKCSNEELDLIIDNVLFKGSECFKKGDFDGALEYFNLSIDLNSCPRTLNYRAISYFVLGRYEDALEDYDVLISQNNKDVLSMYRRCYCLIKLNRLEEAANYLDKTWKLYTDYKEQYPVFKELKSFIDKVKVRFETEKGTLQDALTKVNAEEIYNEELKSYYRNLLKISNNKLNNFSDNKNICYCEMGPGPSYSIIPFPHIKDNYCIQNESNKILSSSNETHLKPRNIKIIISDKTTSNQASILKSNNSKNNKQDRQRSISSYFTTNISNVDIKETLNDQSHTKEPNILVKPDNKRIINNNNDNAKKRICIDNIHDDDQMYQKQNNTF